MASEVDLVATSVAEVAQGASVVVHRLEEVVDSVASASIRAARSTISTPPLGAERLPWQSSESS